MDDEVDGNGMGMVKFLLSIGFAVISALGLLAVLIAYVLVSTPRPTDIRGCLTTRLYAVHLCPKDATYVRLKDVSTDARAAVIVSEDGSFYSHRGIDWFELRESFNKNWEKGEYARGGSTITQQLAKNVYLSADKSLLRKIRELIITVQLEKILSKDEILEKYLNVVEFGPGLYGIGRASRYYFAKRPSELTVADGAFLAFLLPSPARYSASFRHRRLTPFARRQMEEIVNRLYRFKKIDDAELSTAKSAIDNFFGVKTESIPEKPKDGIRDDSNEEPQDGPTPSPEEQPLPDNESAN